MSNRLSDDTVAAFHRDGYLAPIRVMPEAEMAQYWQRVENLKLAHGDAIGPYLRSNPHLVLPWLYDLISDPRILDCVASVLGPNLICWSSSFFAKEAHDPAYVTWHQDSTYWGLEPHEILTAWIAFTPSTRANGCMRVVPGSHKAGQVSHIDTFAEGNLLSRGQEIAVDVDDASAVDIELAPGEMSLHHVRLVHGSEPNSTAAPRYGFTIRFIPTHVRQIGARTTALLARGVDDYGHFDPEPRPQADLDPDALAFHARSAEARNQVLYSGAEQKPAWPQPDG